MSAIRHTLIERWYSFEDAREQAMSDPSINMYAEFGESGLVESAQTQQEEVTILDCLV
jgi:hypothetical protein